MICVQKRLSLALLALCLLAQRQPAQAGPALVADPASFITNEFLASRALLPVNAQYAYARGYTGQGVLVAVIDSGLDVNHPEFRGRVLTQWARNFMSYGGPNDVSDAHPDNSIVGHGTHVTGLIGAARDGIGMHGIAYNATLLPLRAIGGNAAESATRNAIATAVQAGAKVINGSYGPLITQKKLHTPSGPINNPNYVELAKPVLYLEGTGDLVEELEQGANADVVMVFTTGNNYIDQPLASSSPLGNGLLPYITPAAIAANTLALVSSDREDFNIQAPATWDFIPNTHPDVADMDFSHLKGTLITVAAVDREGHISSYSNRCGLAQSWCMVAPGGDFYTTANYDSSVSELWSAYPYSTYDNMAGTSMAAPIVTGAAAIMREAFPYLTARQIIEVMLTTANSTGIYADRNIYGRGLLDLRTAINGPIEFGAWDFPSTFDVDTKGHDSHWSNNIRGTGNLIKRGAGKLTMWGQNTYTGTTRITGGKLVVNGSIDQSALLTIEQEATLGGSGTVGNTRIAGRVEPGNSIGTLTVNGNYTQLPGSALQIEINDQGQSDRVLVNGIADIQNARLELEGLEAGAVGRDFNFLSATTITPGSSFDASALNRTFIGMNAVFSGTTFNLQIRRNATRFAHVGQSGNQRAAAHAIEAQGLGGAAHDTFILLRNPADGPDTLDQLSGEIYASTQSALLNNSGLLYRATADRLWRRSAHLAAPASALSHSSGESWAQVLGNWGHLGATDNAAKAYHSVGGILFGADTRWGENHYAGLAAGFTNESVRATGSSRTHTDGYHLMAYAGWSGSAKLRAGVTQSWYDMNTRRHISFGNFGKAESDARASTTQLFAEVGYPIVSSRMLQFEPYAGVQHVWLRRNAFQESGSAVALSGKSQSHDATFSTLGLRALFDLQTGSTRTLTGSLNLGWRRAWGSYTPSSTQQFATGPQFSVAGANIGRNALVAEAGLALTLGEHSLLSLGYTGQFGNGSQNHGVQARAQWRF